MLARRRLVESFSSIRSNSALRRSNVLSSKGPWKRSCAALSSASDAGNTPNVVSSSANQYVSSSPTSSPSSACSNSSLSDVNAVREQRGAASKPETLMVRSWSRVQSIFGAGNSNEPGKTYSAETPVHPLGLYGEPRLVSETSFEEWRREVEADCKALREVADQFNVETSDKETAVTNGRMFLQLLDSVSARLCLLLDTAEICASSHADADIRKAAAGAYARLSAYVTKLNMDPALYHPLASMVNDPEVLATLSPEEQRVSISLKLEFERDGIHLSPEEKERVEELQAKTRESETQFTQLERYASSELRLSLKESGKIFLDASSLGRFGSVDPKSIPPSYRVIVNSTTLNIAMRRVSDSNLRKRFYIKAHAEGVERNLAALEDLMRVRRNLANALGFKSFAHLSTSYRMAGDPSEVLNFLDKLNERIAPRAKAETRALEALKEEHEPNAGPLQAWDVPYYSNLAVKTEFGSLIERSHEYFTLDGCLQGLRGICNSLFGLHFENVPLDPGESWAEGVQKLEVREEDGTPAGTLYLDLYQRPGKFANPAHFQVRCSHLHRPLSYFGVSKASTPASKAAAAAAAREESHTAYHLPSSVLVCNFDRPGALLHHTQVQTLFHEFGHALHSLMSRTKLQHLSGTRGELDFVETPSQLMEYFCFNSRVVRTFAFHHRTGEPIPQDVVDALNMSRRKFQGMEFQQQIMYAACDQLLFGDGPEARSVQNMVRDPGAASDVLRELNHRYSHIPYTEGTFWLSRFSHFVNYGAAYYSYTYSRAFAADLWHTRFAADPLNREVGDDLRNLMLSHGGARDPHVMLKDLLGRETSVDPLIHELTTDASSF
ncbi:Mitochondrial intermediate peptidase, mitochondrial [Hondaea fermentalgiana]|uniref:Mitochondrial intermediate peptidase, mitochondrial n=1 Tax=Hondaea fermentalgiana TaxID=2315210 RepID=A0A2R5H0D8_9STRA|nr:Mitochondrial intermediate peptidase, mitochondrial [Hondaea fermentalgiana]|eukprot:GBG34523.1 Mitochondrial intermediate peptidase, mitochondrial [Hondaea fermentalgiana]